MLFFTYYYYYYFDAPDRLIMESLFTQTSLLEYTVKIRYLFQVIVFCTSMTIAVVWTSKISHLSSARVSFLLSPQWIHSQQSNLKPLLKATPFFFFFLLTLLLCSPMSFWLWAWFPTVPQVILAMKKVFQCTFLQFSLFHYDDSALEIFEKLLKWEDSFFFFSFTM